MPKKVTIKSTHPDFVEFQIWLDQKLDDAIAVGDAAEVKKINDAVAAKRNANPNLTPSLDTQSSFENSSSIISITRDELTVNVPEFDFYWDQWKDQFGVEMQIEEI